MRKSSLLYCISILILLFFQSQGLYAQQRKITGTVQEGAGNTPLAGATILLDKSDVNVITKADGSFEIPVSGDKVSLVISFVGYQTKTIVIGNNQTTVQVTLNQSSSAQLDDVIVVGYGSQKRSDVTGSVTSIKGSDLTQLPTQRVDQALQGKLAGVVVVNTDGAPGGKTNIRIRGSNSVLGGNNPLVVIDGLQGGDINLVNPNDVESIEVLKDASATAIYGSRGANGVLLITTKRGRIGKPTISYGANASQQSLNNKLDLMSAGEYARTVNAYRMLNNNQADPTPVFTDKQIQDFDATGGTDWQDAVYRKALSHNHQLSVSGGTENTKYFVSGGFLGQEGILLNTQYNRYSFRTNISTKVNNWMNASFNFSSVKDVGSVPAFGGESGNVLLSSTILVSPRWGAVNPVYNDDGSYFVHPAQYGVPDTWNPVATALETNSKAKSGNNNLNINLEFKLLEGLKFSVAGFGSVGNYRNTRFYNEKTKQGLPVDGKVGAGTLSYGEWEYYQNTNMLTYEKEIANHKFSLTGVAEQSVNDWYGSDLEASAFVVGTTEMNDLSGASIAKNTSSANHSSLISYMGRLNYSFMDKYLLTATYRADGSSKFGDNNKWGYFPSVAVAWKMMDEEFIESLNLFSNLKLRASWGVTGNQAINPYQTQASIGSNQNSPINGGTNTDRGFAIVSAANPNLKWESTTQTNVGLDLGFFNGRITATFDVYSKLTENLLLYRQLPGSSGLSSIIDNVGSVENKGLEISIGGSPVVGVVNWNTAFNISFNRNKVLDLGADERIEYNTTMGGYDLGNLMNLTVGKPFGEMRGYGYEGIWKSSERAEAAYYGQMPGDPHYTDINKDGRINLDDLTTIGNATPDFVYGWSNKVSYKGFDLDFMFQGVSGNHIFNQGRIGLESPHNGNSRRLLDRWTIDNQNTDVPGFIDGKSRGEANLSSKISDVDSRTGRWVEDGSYLRLKNVTLGYNFSSRTLSQIKVGNLRAYASVTNWLTVTNYTGYDPEVSSYNEADGQRGVDLGNYPSARVYTIGIDVSF